MELQHELAPAQVQKNSIDPYSTQPLSEASLRNVSVAARLLGYVRFFHPSDQASQLDWMQFSILVFTAVEPAQDIRELCEVLQKCFAPIAPTLVVFPDDDPKVVDTSFVKDANLVSVVHWEHIGVGSITTSDYAGQNQYSSKRIYQSVSAGLDLKPDLGILECKLAPGISFRMPSQLYCDSMGTLPRPQEPYRQSEQNADRPDLRAARFASVSLTWNVFQHFYPYHDALTEAWDPNLDQALVRVALVDQTEGVLDVIRRLVSRANDGHGWVVSGLVDRGWFPSFAAQVVEQQLVISGVAEGEEMLRPGDIIRRVNNEGIEVVFRDLSKTVSSATEGYRNNRMVFELLCGVRNTDLVLHIERASGDSLDVTVSRSRSASSFSEIQREPRPKASCELQSGLWYFDITRADLPTFERNLANLAGAKAIIFDLRGYPQFDPPLYLDHLAKQPGSMGPLLLPRVRLPNRSEMTFEQSPNSFAFGSREPKFEATAIFLSDARAISYSETILSCVQGHKLGIIVGEASAGTNGMVNPFEPGLGIRVYYTGARVLRHDDSLLHGKGILPDIPVSRTIVGIAAGKDEILEAAISLATEMARKH